MVKYIQSLSHKKLRDADGTFVVESPKVVSEFLSSKKYKPKIICAEKEWLSENGAKLSGIEGEIIEIDEDSLERISQLKTPNKVLAIFYKETAESPVSYRQKITLLLDGISDPGNFGTIIRIADWFGIENIVCSENCVDCYNFKVVQSSMGSLSRVNIMYTPLDSFIKSHSNILVYATALSGTSILEMRNISEGFLIIGNESTGISDEVLNLSTKKITIPKYGEAESLNAAVATAIILSHFRDSD